MILGISLAVGLSVFGLIVFLNYKQKKKEEIKEEPMEKKVGLFDYVEYDKTATDQQKKLREKFKELEAIVDGFKSTKYKDYAYCALEQAYFWFGKAIREHQLDRVKK